MILGSTDKKVNLLVLILPTMASGCHWAIHSNALQLPKSLKSFQCSLMSECIPSELDGTIQRTNCTKDLHQLTIELKLKRFWMGRGGDQRMISIQFINLNFFLNDSK